MKRVAKGRRLGHRARDLLIAASADEFECLFGAPLCCGRPGPIYMVSACFDCRLLRLVRAAYPQGRSERRRPDRTEPSDATMGSAVVRLAPHAALVPRSSPDPVTVSTR
jgi:hypothetical protein